MLVFDPICVEFSLTAEQLRRIHAGAARTTFVLAGSGLALQVIAHAWRLRREILSGDVAAIGIDAGLIVVVLLLAVALFAAIGNTAVAKRGSLTIAADGIAGSLDGRPIEIPWSRIESVADTGDAFVFVQRLRLRRPTQQRIAVPKDALTDPAVLWSRLDDLLVAKRGLIRRPGPHTLIVNSAR